nr:Rieske 2Fe-2S domain-containing protein [Priestia flexa]
MDQQQTLKKSPPKTPYPRDCTFSKEDWTTLSTYWYPIAQAAEVNEKPLSVKLLDVNLVVYRTKKQVVVARDLCVHRGTPLSMGWVEEEEIVCPYHGFRYNTEGACTSIPAHPDANISPRLCMTVYPVIEQFGLIWTSLTGEMDNIPQFQAWDDPDFQQIVCPSFDIGVRQVDRWKAFWMLHILPGFIRIHLAIETMPLFPDIRLIKQTMV